MRAVVTIAIWLIAISASHLLNGDDGVVFRRKLSAKEQASREAMSDLISLQTQIVQRELRLSNAQIEKVNQVRRTFDLATRKISEDYYKPGPNEFSDLRFRLIDDAAATLPTTINALLSNAQRVRLKQLDYQAMGTILFEPETVEKLGLGLTVTQKKTVAAFLKEFETRDESGIVVLSTDFDIARERESDQRFLEFDRAQEHTLVKIEKVLTDDQREKLATLRGPKIDIAEYHRQRRRAAIVVHFNSPPGVDPPHHGTMTIQ